MAYLKRELCSWGLAILLACFIVNFVIDGVRFSFGILFEVFTKTFGKDARTTAWIGSLMFSVLNFGGPVGSVCVRKFGCRITTILGSLICFVGFILSAYVPNLYFLYFSLGILVGFGMSLMYVAQTVIVLRYFKSNRTFAVGVSICGSGIGASTLTFILKIIDDLYSWSSLMLILSGILLQTAVAGTLMRPKTEPPPDQYYLKCEEASSKDKEIKPIKETSTNDDKLRYIEENKQVKSSEYEANKLEINGTPKQTEDIGQNTDDNTHTHEEQTSLNEFANVPNKSKSLKDSKLKDLSKGKLDTKAGHEGQNGLKESKSIGDKEEDIEGLNCVKQSTGINQLKKKYQQNEEKAKTPPEKRQSTHSNSLYSIYSVLLKDVKVHLFLGSQFCIGVGLMIPFTFIPRVVMDKGHSNYNAVWLLSSVNISNIVCRLLIGVIADRKFVNRSYLYTISIFVLPVTGMGYALFDDYSLLMVSSCLLGAGLGVMITLFSVVMTDIFGEKRCSEVFGLSIFSRGPGNLLGPPLAGYIIDVTGTPSHVFFLFSGLMMMGTILTVVFVYIHTRQLKRMTNLGLFTADHDKNHKDK